MPVYQEGNRNPLEPTVIQNDLPGSQYNWVSDPVVINEWPQNGSTFLVEGHPYNLKPFISESLIKPDQIRNLLTAWTTPGCKKT